MGKRAPSRGQRESMIRAARSIGAVRPRWTQPSDAAGQLGSRLKVAPVLTVGQAPLYPRVGYEPIGEHSLCLYPLWFTGECLPACDPVAIILRIV
jgi:hypothetical protein